MIDAVDPVLDEIEFVPPVLNPVHNVLNLCGVTAAMSCQVFINIQQGLDTINSFANLNGNSNVTEMAKCMASCTATNGGGVLSLELCKLK